MSIKSNNLIFWIYVTFALLYVSLAMHLPVSIYTGTGAGHDDSWFVSRAENILAGEWLGTFNNMTLIKGVGYPYFLVFNNLLGTPITLTLAMLYLAACFFFICVLRNAGLHRLIALCLFVVLIFQPALFPTRIIRDNIYFSLFLISVSGLIYAALHRGVNDRFILVGASGFCFGLFWITREEGVWVLPGFAFIVLYSLVLNGKEKRSLGLLIRALSIYILGALTPLFITGLLNLAAYGSFQNVDVKNSSFVNVLNALNKVEVGEEIPYIPVPQKKREVIYKVSPAFRELQTYFEDTGKGWTLPGCEIYKHTCGDYAGGWFLWALRDGASYLGYYKDPASAAKYYERIVREINLACNDGTLMCASNPAPYLPRFSRDAISNIPKKIIEAINLTVYKKPVPLSGGPSWKPFDRLNEVLDFLGNPKIVRPKMEPILAISGWYYAPLTEWVILNCGNGDSDSYRPISRHASLDIAEHFKDENAIRQRFSFEVSEFKNCSISFSNSVAKEIPLTDLLQNQRKWIHLGNGILNFDTLTVLNQDLSTHDNWMSGKSLLIKAYEGASIYIFGVGILCFVATSLLLFLGKQRPDDLLVIALLLWIFYCSRVALVVMVDVSSFPAITHGYLLPAFPLWAAASFLSISALFKVLRRWERKNL